MHNEVSRRGLNGDSAPGLRVRGRASPFLRAFAVPMRFAVGTGSNKRTVGRFSFCGLSPDPYSLPVSLFRGGGGGERASVTLRLCTVPQVLLSRKEPWRSRELFLSRCLANRRGAPRCLPVDERRNYHFIDIESPSSLCRRLVGLGAMRSCWFSRGRVSAVIYSRRKWITARLSQQRKQPSHF